MTSHLLSPEARKKIEEALKTATTGLAWYRAECPNANSSADDEAEEQINIALALLADLPEAPSVDMKPMAWTAQEMRDLSDAFPGNRAALADERAKFEAWVRSTGVIYGLGLREGERYERYGEWPVQLMWDAWQAARAAERSRCVKVLEAMHMAQLGRATEHNHFAVASQVLALANEKTAKPNQGLGG